MLQNKPLINPDKFSEINRILDTIEKDNGIRILYACESGSRAWGFPSPDSDYDVRFIYIRQRDDYLSLTPYEDNIKPVMIGDIDVVGWDITKLLKLARKTNMTASEWINSPIVYRSISDNFIKETNDIIDICFSPHLGYRHHIGMAKKTRLAASEIGNQLPLKKSFYVIRSLLCALFIAINKEQPPTQFTVLAKRLSESGILVEEFYREIYSAIELKATSTENDAKPPSKLLELMDDLYTYVMTIKSDDLIESDVVREFRNESVDKFFLTQLGLTK